MRKKSFKIVTVSLAVVAIFLIVKFHFLPIFSLATMQRYFSTISGYYAHSPSFVIAIYMLLYIFSNALPVPLMLLLTLFGGAVFGPLVATPIVLVSATLAAIVSALLSRFILRRRIETRYRGALTTINNGLKTNGLGFLLSLRLVPVFPFFVVNFLLGLTRVPLYILAATTFVGLAPSVIIYTLAGEHLSRIHSIHDALSPGLLALLLGFAVIAFLPSLLGWIKKYRKNNEVGNL